MKTDNQNKSCSCLPDADIDVSETTLLHILRVADMLVRIGDSKVFGKTVTQAQFNILMILKRHGQEGMSQKGILENLVSTKGNVSIHINNLLSKGYVHRKTAKSDGRMHVIRLTAKGERILKELEPKYMQQLRRITEDLSRKQAETAIALLEQLSEKCKTSLSNAQDE